MDHRDLPEYHIVVVDIGGGTTDMSLFRRDPERRKFTHIISAGDSYLGGKDFDKVIYKFTVDEFKKETLDDDDNSIEPVDFTKQPEEKKRTKMIQWAWNNSEYCKLQLSQTQAHDIDKENIIDGVNLEVPILRSDFDKNSKQLMKQLTAVLDRLMLSDASKVGGETWRDLKARAMREDY